MIETVTATENYGPIKRGQSYRLQSIGQDFYQVKVQGKVYSVPQWAFE
jgi:hypothetical protein